MDNLDGILKSGPYEGSKKYKLVPLVLRYAAGAPAIAFNPSNESIALTDTGTGDVKLTFAEASLMPLFVVGATPLPAAAGTLGLLVNLKTAPTSTVVELLTNSGADGATETDPVDIHLLVIKVVA